MSWFGQFRRSKFDPDGERSLFFSRIWIYAAIAVVVLGIAAKEPAISLIGFLILTAAGFSSLWNRASLGGIRFQTSLPADRAFPGDILELELLVVNEKPLPVPRFSIEIELSNALIPVDRPSTADGLSNRRTLRLETILRPFERRTWRVPFECRQRGAHVIGPTTLRSGDPFGFFANRHTIADRREVVVFPSIMPFDGFDVLHRLPLGELSSRRALNSDPLKVAGVRDYRPDDPFRSIHWKATARLGALQVKVNDPVAAQSIQVLLNLDTFSHYWEGLNIGAAEEAIEAAASVAHWGLDRGIPVGLLANGIVVGSDQPLHVPAALGFAQESRVMNGLARLWAFSTVPFVQILRAVSDSARSGSTIVVVTPMMSPGIEAHFRSLLLSGRTLMLIPIGEMQLPDLRGLKIVVPSKRAGNKRPSNREGVAA